MTSRPNLQVRLSGNEMKISTYFATKQRVELYRHLNKVQKVRMKIRENVE